MNNNWGVQNQYFMAWRESTSLNRPTVSSTSGITLPHLRSS
jgi:hypothetical protein